LRALKLFLPGDYKDAYLYRGMLLVVTSDLELRACRIDRIDEDLGRKYRRDALLITSTLQRWRRNADPERFGASLIDDLAGYYNKSHPTSDVVLNIDEGMLSAPQKLDVQGFFLLDMDIYKRSLYACTDDGLFRQDLEWEREDVGVSGDAVKWHDAECLHVSLRYETMNVSCGDDGLFTTHNGHKHSDEKRRPSLKQTAKKSMLSRWIGPDVINYPDYDDPVFLKSDIQKSPDVKYQQIEVAEIGVEEYQLKSGFGKRIKTVAAGSIDFTFNTEYALFIHTRDNDLFSLGIRHNPEEPPELTTLRSFGKLSEQILSAHFCRSGQIVESFDRVLVLTRDEKRELVASRGKSIRTYNRSAQFQDVVTVTANDGVHVIYLIAPQS